MGATVLFDDAAFSRTTSAGPAPLSIKRVTEDDMNNWESEGFPVRRAQDE